MDINKFISLRPVLYHLTDRRNLDSILNERMLKSTDQLSLLCDLPNRKKFLRTRRPIHEQIKNGNVTYHIRDQKPFSETIIKKSLEKGCTVEDFIYLLNTKVFFWAKLSDLESHFNRYAKAGEKPIIFRINTEELFNLNTPPKFCRLNSGGPRCSAYLGGKGAERGYNTFLSAEKYGGNPSSVKEVTFENNCTLPEIIHVGNHPGGPFKRI
jgi:hypothetical protein